MIKILSVDGGGLRGIIPATVLLYLQRQLDNPLGTYFDLITGTSTGGIIALGLAKNPPLTMDKILELYVRRSDEIFSKGWGEYLPWMFRRKYNHESLEALLIEFLGKEELTTCRTRVMIPVRDLVERKTVWFKSWRALGAVPMWEVARATSAAHTYFCAHKNLADGGTSVGNPAACAAAEARVLWPSEEVLLVSMGTGVSTKSLAHLACEGYGKWAPHLSGEFMDGAADAVDYQMDKDPGVDYRRFQIKLISAKPDMDDASSEQINGLLRDGERLISKNKLALDQLVKDLKE